MFVNSFEIDDNAVVMDNPDGGCREITDNCGEITENRGNCKKECGIRSKRGREADCRYCAGGRRYS